MNKKLSTTFYIVRHGETDWNVKKLLQGQMEIPLNEKGALEALELRTKLKNIKIDLIFSSDLERAYKTVEPIAMERGLTIKTTPLLRERSFGRLEGSPVSALNKFSKIFNGLSKADRFKYKYYPEVESDEETVSRALAFLRKTAIDFPNKTILVSTHRAVMYSLLIYLGYMDYYLNSKRPIKTIAYIKLEANGVNFFVRKTSGIEINKKRLL